MLNGLRDIFLEALNFDNRRRFSCTQGEYYDNFISRLNYAQKTEIVEKWNNEIKCVQKVFDSITREQYRKMQHAHWIEKLREWDLGDPPQDYTDYTCSNCKMRVQYPSRFCPDCGAKMDEEIKDNAQIH